MGPVLRGALGRLEAEASTSSQGQAPAAAEALAARIAGLRAVLDAVPRNKDGSAQRDLPLQALFSSEHPVIKGLLQRYGALPATGAFTGKGVRFAIPVVKVVRLPPTTKAGTQWANVDVAAGKYRVAERQFVEGWRTTQDFVLGRPGKYKLHVVPRQPLPKGVPVVGCDPGVNCPLFTDTGVYLFSEDWYRARRLRIQSRKKPSNVRRAEGELATTIARAVGQLEYLEYVKKRGGEVRHGAGVGRAVVGCVVCVVCGVCVGWGRCPTSFPALSPVTCVLLCLPCPLSCHGPPVHQNEATLMAHYGSGVKLRAHETLLARKRSLLATILAAIAPDPNVSGGLGGEGRAWRAAARVWSVWTGLGGGARVVGVVPQCARGPALPPTDPPSSVSCVACSLPRPSLSSATCTGGGGLFADGHGRLS